jgi:hypothetical protein
MATRWKVDGTSQVVFPKNGRDFSLEELKFYIGGGYIELVNLDSGSWMVVDENGKLKHLPVNRNATKVYLGTAAKNGYASDVIVGDILVCSKSEIK